MKQQQPSPRGFTLAADDYALTRGVSRAILTLLEEGRISATGAMTNRPFWREGAKALTTFSGKADLGVHVTLTCGAPLTRMARLAPGGELPKLPPLLARCLAGTLPKAEIAAELNAQLDAFEQAMGHPPDYVDGHQHIHAMPGIRAVLADVLASRYPGQKPYIRNAADGARAILARGVEARKALLVSALTTPFAAGMRARGFTLNDSFSGYSAFDAKRDYAGDFARYLIAPGKKPLIMCHPGFADAELAALDPATMSREVEFAFFRSPQFTEICAEAGMVPMRFPRGF